MTGRGSPGHSSRRRFLATAGVGLAGALAGCGYRPGGGDLAWESSLGGGGMFGAGDRWFRPAGDRLFVVRNQSGRTFDFEEDAWRDYENAEVTGLDPAGDARLEAETDRQATGVPAVTETSVFVPVEGGRVTAIDRERAALDLDDPTVDTADSGGDEADEPDPVRWRTDAIAESADGGTGDDDGVTGDAPAVTVDAVRAGGRLAVAVTRDDAVVLDAGSGDRAFAVAEAWPDAGDGSPRSLSPDRVAVDGDAVWVALDEGDSGGARIARFDAAGEWLATRSLEAGVDWLTVVDDAVVVAADGGPSVRGFDRDLGPRFALDVPAPNERPPVGGASGDDGETSGDDGAGRRVYLHRGEVVRALDVAAGEVAWEHAGLPASRPTAVDDRGIYGVGEESGGDGVEPGPALVAVGADGDGRWSAPLPEGVRVEELYAVGGRLIAVDGEDLYGFRAEPGERWSLLG
ncbi:hypothetical protein DJ73_17200 [Halorubrum sp. Ea1]|uniref:hypothetical protein n=1 Tax=Halorubrum sp. Ea1 TaxID=1480718 RepID=UPI000B982BFD|nr:hypothetical protein [Halorubrum sp. Ea1]OYR49646.1 hypothetical protein DJ73_17200 [Halorubrum sp. Ea1]